MSATPESTLTTPDTPTTCALNNQIPDEYWEEVSKACAGDASYEVEGKYYCVLHYPSQAKIGEFRVALRKKIADKDFNFYGVYFPEEVDFSNQTPSKPANFSYANFCCNVSFAGVRFSDGADFSYAIFSGNAYFSYSLSFNRGFSYATFCDKADFSHVTFSGAVDFSSARFGSAENGGRVIFTEATFSSSATFLDTKFHGMTDFSNTTFSGLTLFTTTEFLKEINFRNAQFKDYVKFKDCIFGEKAVLTFDSLRVEKPERLSFHSVKLRPHWFINTDPRKFEFIDVRWDDDLAQECSASKSERLLSIAYRQLAMNAEENNRYGEAAQFRYNSMDLRRLEKSNGRAFWTLDFWYWYLSRFGEDVYIAFARLLLILFLCCVPYWFVGFSSSKEEKIGAPIRGLSSIVYSLETASLQKPEPRPVTTAARFFVGLETILAPLQAALLALAIRRKYMR